MRSRLTRAETELVSPEALEGLNLQAKYAA